MTQLAIHTRDHRTESLIKVYSANMLLNAVSEVARKHRSQFYQESLKVREYAASRITEKLEQVKADYPKFSQVAASIEAAKQLEAECYEKTGHRPLCSQIEISICDVMTAGEHEDVVVDPEFIGRIDIPIQNDQVLDIWNKLTTSTG